jgi:bacterioferritin
MVPRFNINKQRMSILKIGFREDEMKGNDKIIDKLNSLLADELTAISQYMVHAEMCDNWGYEKLHKINRQRAIDEMKHAERLIERILFLEGVPILSHLNKINIGATVESQHNNDLASEIVALKGYNEGIKLALEVSDNGSRELFASILKDEESHIDVIEMELGQIEQVGKENYLAEQIS